MSPTTQPQEWEVISVYTAADALEDGILTDVSKTAREAGFKIPVRITAGVLALIEPDEKARKYGQDFAGRLWNVLWMCSLAVRRNPDDYFAEFLVIFQNGPGNRNRKNQRLFAALDGTSGPAIHIMTPEEY